MGLLRVIAEDGPGGRRAPGSRRARSLEDAATHKALRRRADVRRNGLCSQNFGLPQGR